MLCKECYLVQKPQLQSNVAGFPEGGELVNVAKGRTGSSIPSNLLNKSIIIGTDDPLHILKIRFAKGEISKEDYQEMKRLLQDD
jgi:hypothetical protein